MADPRTPLVEVETLRHPSRYTHKQLAQACLIAGCCMQAFGAVRFVYAQEPDD